MATLTSSTSGFMSISAEEDRAPPSRLPPMTTALNRLTRRLYRVRRALSFTVRLFLLLSSRTGKEGGRRQRRVWTLPWGGLLSQSPFCDLCSDAFLFTTAFLHSAEAKRKKKNHKESHTGRTSKGASIDAPACIPSMFGPESRGGGGGRAREGSQANRAEDCPSVAEPSISASHSFRARSPR